MTLVTKRKKVLQNSCVLYIVCTHITKIRMQVYIGGAHFSWAREYVKTSKNERKKTF
jgi:hypothetical protein